MVVACLALFVALAGTSVAAVSQLVPRNSVGTAQLRDNAVARVKVRNNAINSTKVQNRSLLAVDFATGSFSRSSRPSRPRGWRWPGRTRRCGRAARSDRLRDRDCLQRGHDHDAELGSVPARPESGRSVAEA